MSTQDRVEALRKMRPNTWLALAHDESRVVAEGETYFEAAENASKAGEDDPILLKAPSDWHPMVL